MYATPRNNNITVSTASIIFFSPFICALQTTNTGHLSSASCDLAMFMWHGRQMIHLFSLLSLIRFMLDNGLGNCCTAATMNMACVHLAGLYSACVCILCACCHFIHTRTHARTHAHALTHEATYLQCKIKVFFSRLWRMMCNMLSCFSWFCLWFTSTSHSMSIDTLDELRRLEAKERKA